jgi:hypothetical protein
MWRFMSFLPPAVILMTTSRLGSGIFINRLGEFVLRRARWDHHKIYFFREAILCE